MAAEIVLSIIARDRPGLVQTVAETVAGHGGNWIDSAMARLGGEFAGIVRVSVAEDKLGELERAVQDLSGQDFAVSVRHTSGAEVISGQPAEFELTGSDHPGIVRDISAVFARHGVSIAHLETGVFPGSMSGDKMFTAKARIVLPDGTSAESLREELEAIAQDIMVDIDLRKIET